jgi:hypothetical protein
VDNRSFSGLNYYRTYISVNYNKYTVDVPQQKGFLSKVVILGAQNSSGGLVTCRFPPSYSNAFGRGALPQALILPLLQAVFGPAVWEAKVAGMPV